MARILTCAQCQASLSVPDDMLGKFVRCPTCTATFLAPPLAEPVNPEAIAVRTDLPPSAPLWRGGDERPRQERDERDRWRDDDADDRDVRAERADEPGRRIDPGWLTVKNGLHTMFVGGLIVLLAVVVCFFLLLIIGMSEGGRRNNPATGILAVGLICLGMLVVLGGGITSLVGRFMCLATPDARARGFLGGHLIFLVVSGVLAVILVIVFVAMVDSRNRGDQWNMHVALALLSSLDILTFLVSAILLNLFLKGVALSFNNTILAGACTAFLVFETFWLLGSTGLAMLSLGLEPNNFVQEGRVAWVLGVVVIGGGGSLVSAIWSLTLLRGGFQVIRQHAREYARRRYPLP